MTSATPEEGGEEGAGLTRSKRPAWLRWLPLTATVPFLALLAFGLTRDARIIPSPLPGEPAPEFALETLDGDSVRLSDIHGRVAIVNFWASWCIPCREEHSVLRQLRQRYPETDVALMGILYQDTPDDGRSFMREFGGNWPSGVDPGSRLAIEFGVYGVPETFFLARDGTIARKRIGPLIWESARATVDSLLAAGAEPDPAGAKPQSARAELGPPAESDDR